MFAVMRTHAGASVDWAWSVEAVDGETGARIAEAMRFSRTVGQEKSGPPIATRQGLRCLV